MSTPILPTDGETPWGDELNTGILQVNSTANNAVSGLNSHTANIPSDPHGDRAYSQSLVSPITTGVNGPNGYVKLNSSGKLLSSLVSTSAGGAFTNIFDAVAQYGVAAGTGSDQSVALQNALTACGSAGGGIVWVGGSGTISLSNYVVIPNNTWLLLGEEVVLSRLSSSAAYLITNVKFGTSNTPAVNVKISGGKLDAVGSGLTSACTPIFLIQSTGSTIEDIVINNVFNNPCIEINGSSGVEVLNCSFSGTNHSSGSPATVPAIRINTSSSSTTPSGLSAGFYNNAVCNKTGITNCFVLNKTGSLGPFAGIVGSDRLGSAIHEFIVITGCVMPYNDNQANQVSIFSQNAWDSFSVSGCIFPENNTGFDSWSALTLQNSWVNSNVGPIAQWRWITLGSGGGADALPIGNTIEIIGDVVTGTASNGTVVASLPNYFSFASGQIIPVVFPSFAASVSSRLYIDNATNHIVCENMTGYVSERLYFHAFLSTTA